MNAQLYGSSTHVTGVLLVVVGVIGLVQLTLDVIALVDLVRRPLERGALGNKWVWVAVILLVNVIGAIVYLAVGRRPADIAEVPAPTQLAPRARSVADSLYGPRDVVGEPRPDVAPGAAAGPDEQAPRPDAAGPR